MNDHAYLYANTSDKSIMYDLAVHCALVEVPPVPGGGLKRILSSSPSPSRSCFNQRLRRSSGCKISCCLIYVRWRDQQPPRPLWTGWSWEKVMPAWGDWEGGEVLWEGLWGSGSTPGWDGARSGGLDEEKHSHGSIWLSTGWGYHRLVPPDFKLM